VSRALKSLALFAAFVVIITLSRHEIDLGPSTTTTSSTTSTTSTSTTTTTSNTTPVSTCVGSDFRGVYNEGQGAAGTITASITLTKITAGTCTLYGWPKLTLQDTTGAVLTSSVIAERPGNQPIRFTPAQADQAPSLLTLATHATANFALAYSDVPTSTAACPTARTISVQIAAGGTTATVTPDFAIMPCNQGTMWVSPFYQ
jgi:Protein of unknown function (DUF4232)